MAALLAAALGVIAVLFVLFGPLYSTAASSASADSSASSASSDGPVTQTFGTESLLQAGLEPLTAVVLGIVLAASIGIGLGGLLHGRTGITVWRGLLAVSTILVMGIAILGALSIGIFLLPSVALGFVALAAGARPSSGPEGWPRA